MNSYTHYSMAGLWCDEVAPEKPFVLLEIKGFPVNLFTDLLLRRLGAKRISLMIMIQLGGVSKLGEPANGLFPFNFSLNQPHTGYPQTHSFGFKVPLQRHSRSEPGWIV